MGGDGDEVQAGAGGARRRRGRAGRRVLCPRRGRRTVNGAEATTLWARTFADELARAGVRQIVIAPGSRSTPLVLAFAADGRFRTRVHLDERSAAFFALGVGKATGGPAALVTTSGTAAANAYPAVVEASQSEVPLLVLTADRPHRLRDADANQAIDQLRLFGPYVRSFFEAAPPVKEGPALRHLRALAGRAVLLASEAPAGPVHVNFPFDKPLEPAGPSAEGAAFAAQAPLAAAGRAEEVPFVDARPARRGAPADELARLTGLVAEARCGVVVAGPNPEPWRVGDAAVRLAAATGFPLLAAPLSGARFRPSAGAQVVDGYDLFLRDAYVRERLQPDLVLRVGASPTSAALQGWMEHHAGVRHVVVDGGGRWKDYAAVATDYVRADAADTLRILAGNASRSTDSGWSRAWGAAAAATRAAVDAAAGGAPYEGEVLAAVARVAPAGSTLFVSSSMPVRDLDAFAAPRTESLTVLANRGASGIDGIVSSAFGVASASSGATVCVLGDGALFHDQNGLLWSRERDAAVVFVLVDNDGGGIFHMLPVREYEPWFTSFFTTPHGLDFQHAARMHGVPLEDATTSGAGDALARALAAGGTRIVRVRTDRAAVHRRRRELCDAVAGSVRAALG
ncbi:MAG: 2-succinyl-5-enolpyruvyl-6-hydroxy-3-cyclohexene-1-carboxylic-acid synthase [Gemmatimonadetes bacterium]|nr:2-succinyl-5-enolpyruvyl-6-hydroxy-3-cyclohexene-1-carboxylic-acid synthase [Gemmatimonadota bacterium]